MNNTAEAFPRWQLMTAGIVLGGVLLLSATARLTDFTASRTHPAVIAAYDLQFHDLPNGGVAVIDAPSGRTVAQIAARDDGFLRTTMRVLAGGRARDHISSDKPFRLTQLAGGRLELTDLATGQRVELEAFGPSNVAEFTHLLREEEHP
jgi:putative photosynthetic complex assembly protein